MNSIISHRSMTIICKLLPDFWEVGRSAYVWAWRSGGATSVPVCNEDRQSAHYSVCTVDPAILRAEPKKVTRIRRFHVKLYRHVSQPYSHIVISRMEKGLYCQQTWSDWDWLHSAVDRFMSGRCFAIELTASFGRWQFFNVKQEDVWLVWLRLWPHDGIRRFDRWVALLASLQAGKVGEAMRHWFRPPLSRVYLHKDEVNEIRLDILFALLYRLSYSLHSSNINNLSAELSSQRHCSQVSGLLSAKSVRLY